MDRTDTHAERLLTQARALTPESTDDAVNDIIRQTAKGRVLPSTHNLHVTPRQSDSIVVAIAKATKPKRGAGSWGNQRLNRAFKEALRECHAGFGTTDDDQCRKGCWSAAPAGSSKASPAFHCQTAAS